MIRSQLQLTRNGNSVIPGKVFVPRKIGVLYKMNNIFVKYLPAEFPGVETGFPPKMLNAKCIRNKRNMEGIQELFAPLIFTHSLHKKHT